MSVVTAMQYDEQGRNIHREYGNGVWTDYQYEPQRNRLDRMQTVSPYCPLQDVIYSYDGVSNITTIMQSEPSCNTLGGQYNNIYTYDAQNRLINALSPSGSSFLYDFHANYSPAGRFGHGFCGNTSGVADESSLYGYDDHRLTHQPRVIFDSNNNRHTQLLWDANGNLTLLWMCEDKFARFHDWDDENRLRMVVGNEQAGFYGYDANGDRVYKLTGRSEITNIGPELSDAFVRFDTAVLYPNPYVTITPKEYTKHYYANGERLATSIGQGGWCFTSPDVISNPQTEHEVVVRKLWHDIYSGQYPFEYPHEPMPEMTKNVDIADNPRDELQYRCPIRHLQRLKIDYEPDILLASMQSYCWPEEPERDIFYTHGDHLGSANWITDYTSAPIQYVHYLPYGQLLANQTPYGYDERYKFTGKERDGETGYDFFGARYYWALFKHWTKVDPLVDDYLHISPYAYCNWNPVKYKDPDGKAIHVAVGAVIGAAIGGTISGISAINDPTKSRRQVLGAIAGGAVSGAITGGLAAATGGLSFIGTGGTIAISAGAGFIGESAGSAVSQGIGNGEIDGGEVVRAGLVGAAAGVITGAASKGVSEAVKKSGVVQSIQTKMLNGVKSGTGKAAKQQANQTRKSIINFCSPGNDKQFQMQDLITYPADVVGQEVSTGVTTSGAVVDKTQEVQSNVANKLGL